ncbi:MAG: TonB-dependent receptor, partial [Breznakibacter sp.]|nr:TonB-dependent receptor [Breznakibacter sp.]
FFKELYTPSGEINENIKAQKSIHFLIGSNYFFKVSDRPFKFTTELYYKHLTDIIPYNVDNVRVKYLGYNNAKGYAAGLDMKLNGELVPGLESWATLSFMKTEEDILNDSIVTKNSDGSTSVSYPGYIPRPSDQRVNFSLFFQDYLPKYPSFKVHLNLIFGTGLPFGPPDSPRYKATLRMPPYRRVDIGFSKELTGSQNHPDKVWGPVKKLWLGVDVFNLLNISNTISYYWVTDIRSNQYAVPNYMTSRRVNVKIVANF